MMPNVIQKYRLVALTALLLLFSFQSATAQDIVRLELDASDHTLPYYTIPVGRDGVIVVRGTDSRGRRVTAWELLHFDVALRQVNRHTFTTERGEYFSGWKVNDTHLALLFLHDVPVRNGHFMIYQFAEQLMTNLPFSLEGRVMLDPVFHLSQNHVYLSGIHRSGTGWGSRMFSALSGRRPVSELVTIMGEVHKEEVNLLAYQVPGLRSVKQAHTLSKSKESKTVLALEVKNGRFQREIRVVTFNHTAGELFLLGKLSSSPERYIDDVTFLSTDSIPLAMAGTYGTRTRREWNNDDQVAASGLFFSAINLKGDEQIRTYPFNAFSHLLHATARKMAQTGRSGAVTDAKGQVRFRVLLHNQQYQQNGNTLLVGETFFPEYEYDQRVQQFYMPYSYYGYYPGIYDRGGRWIFKGFRYEHALVAAFNPTGDLVWENSFEASDILDQQLVNRLTIMPYDDEVVMVYAHDGRVIYRVIREREVLVDKESIPIELPAQDDRIRENYAMNMAPWYDNFFIVWGRQHIRNTDGKSRTVYYCNKIAFE